MKRYKLKKDLPTFKAGEEFYISQNGNLVKRGEYIFDCIVAYAAQTLEKFPNILTDWFEEIPEELKTAADLRDGDRYYFIQNDGFVCCSIWDHDETDKGRAEIGNIFLTEEEAVRALARRKAKQILLHDTNGYKPDLKDLQSEKWYAYYSIGDRCIYTLNERSWVEDRIYFASEEEANASIKRHRKEWLTYFGVEE